MAGDLEIGLAQKLKEKSKLGMMFVGFICSCGLYEFAGVFWMTYFNPFLQTSIGKKIMGAVFASWIKLVH